MSTLQNTAAILVVPHFDDECFMTGSFLLKYKGNLEVIFTHPTDFVKGDKYTKQYEMMMRCYNDVKDYRLKHCINSDINITILTTSNDKGIPEGSYGKGIATIESVVNKYDHIDYFIYSVRSSHQCHTESHEMAESVLRSPYIEKMSNVLSASYPQSYFGIPNNDSECHFNTYVTLTKEDVEFMHHLINDVYGDKNPPDSILSADGFSYALKYFGLACQSEYAQPFIEKKRIIDLK